MLTMRFSLHGNSLSCRVLYNTYYYSMEIFQPFFGYYFVNVLLMILQLLHVFWSCLIIRMVYKFILQGTVWIRLWSPVPRVGRGVLLHCLGLHLGWIPSCPTEIAHVHPYPEEKGVDKKKKKSGIFVSHYSTWIAEYKQPGEPASAGLLFPKHRRIVSFASP